MSRSLVTPVIALLIAVGHLALPASSLGAGRPVSVDAPRVAQLDRLTAVTVRLPAKVAAVEGRLLVRRGAAEVVGIAPVGGGTAFRPVEIETGAVFGAYDLRASNGSTVLDIVIVPRQAGQLQIRLAVDSAADADGLPVNLKGSSHLKVLRVAGGSTTLGAPAAKTRIAPTGPVHAARELLRDGRIDKRDLDTLRGSWELARERDVACRPGTVGDVNGDGCVDIIDVQAILAAQGESTTAAGVASGIRQSSDGHAALTADGRRTTVEATAAADVRTFTVVSAVDNPDVAPGNGICADALGLCTLRAAMTEADWLIGDDRIEFALAGTAPVLIQLGSRLPDVTARNGSVTIDGYTQPGSVVNDAAFGSNAVPGVEIRGNGSSAREYGFRITSPRNVIRGLLMHNIWRPIMLDGTAATDNRIVGNLLGFKRDGTNSTSGNFGVTINTGAKRNVIGTSDRADRNVIGNHSHAIENYGPGTEQNVMQGNLLCMRPSGLATATCNNGIDHNFGPKNGLIGGTGPERNIIGPTSLQCIELSHGWDPALGSANGGTLAYQINGHRVIGNWVGFRGDGSYAAGFRCGLNFSSADNGQGINVYDGSNENLVEGNVIGSVYDGVQVMSPNANRNIVRGNLIGESPLGEPAPLTRWGVVARWGTTFDVIEGNTIRNAAAGGIGLLNTMNTGALTSTAYNIRISRNIVTDTAGPAIDLLPLSGPNPNDAGDADDGANTLLNTPVLTSATTSVISGTAVDGSSVEVYRASRASGAHGLPVEFLGSATAGAAGTWSVPVSLAQGDRVTALQIARDANTSELSANIAVGEAPPPPPPPGPGDLVGADDFQRTVAGGWGNAATGGPWTLMGSNVDFSVEGGQGAMSVAASRSREASLAVEAADTITSGTVRFDRVPTGGNAFAYVDARLDGTTAYRATIRIDRSARYFAQIRKAVNNSESAIGPEVALPEISAGAATLAFRFEVVDTALRFRVWEAGATEPAIWHTTALDSTAELSDPGAVGLRAYTGGPVSNGPVKVSWDDIEIRLSGS